MSNIKIERLNHTYQQEISIIIEREIKDEEINFVTITDVDITNDLSYARVYYTVLDLNKKESTQKALDKASSFIRKELAKKVEVRNTPELKFIYDESEDYGNHIDEIIDKIHEQDKTE